MSNKDTFGQKPQQGKPAINPDSNIGGSKPNQGIKPPIKNNLIKEKIMSEKKVATEELIKRGQQPNQGTKAPTPPTKKFNDGQKPNQDSLRPPKK